MFWIALAFPHLPLEAAAPGDGRARALVRQHRIACLDAAAAAAGVRLGQKRANALALCPQLDLIERDPARERQAIEAAALALMRFTPAIARVECAIAPEFGAEAGLLLEVQASLRLFGGAQALLHAVRYTLAELGLSAEIACFPTATGAWLLAQAAIAGAAPPDGTDALQTLDALPVQVLDAAQSQLDAVVGIGATRLRQLRLLPRAGLARRFGQALLDELDRAYGDAPDPRAWLTPPEEFHAQLELFARVEQAEALLFAARRLLVQLVGWLAARQAAVREFTLELEHEFYKTADRARSHLTIALAEPTRDLDHLVLLLREHLARTPLAAPVLELALHATRLETGVPVNAELFPTQANEAASLTRLIERLSARLGPQAIECLELVEDHRPEAAQKLVPYAQARRTTGPAARTEAVHTEPPAAPRPAWLLPEPIRLPVRQHRPQHCGPLTLIAGPERIEAGWWNRIACRDYFIAENQDAELLWIYRERLTGGDEQWYLQGKFA